MRRVRVRVSEIVSALPGSYVVLVDVSTRQKHYEGSSRYVRNTDSIAKTKNWSFAPLRGKKQVRNAVNCCFRGVKAERRLQQE